MSEADVTKVERLRQDVDKVLADRDAAIATHSYAAPVVPYAPCAVCGQDADAAVHHS